MNKSGNLYNISAFSLVFSIISIIYIFISLFGYVTANDYLFYNLQNITEQLEDQGAVSEGTSALTQSFGDDFTGFNLNLDHLWLISYIVFISSSFVVAYRSKSENNFSFLGLLFYGMMFFLFMLTFFTTIANWFNVNILTAILPTAYILVPKFYFYLDNIGIFSAIHLGICLLINMVDFDFSKTILRKNQETKVLDDEEML